MRAHGPLQLPVIAFPGKIVTVSVLFGLLCFIYCLGCVPNAVCSQCPASGSHRLGKSAGSLASDSVAASSSQTGLLSGRIPACRVDTGSLWSASQVSRRAGARSIVTSTYGNGGKGYHR